MISGNLATLVRPVCDFQQNGDQLTGARTGPNDAGNAVGLAVGGSETWQWRMVPTNNIGLAGISSFNGQLGPDHVVRGWWTFTGRPGGQRTVHRAKAMTSRGRRRAVARRRFTRRRRGSCPRTWLGRALRRRA